MGVVSGIIGWLGWAGIIAGLASLASAIIGSFTVSYAGISLPDTLPGAIGILAAGIVLAVLAGMLRRKSGCGCCCGGDHSE